MNVRESKAIPWMDAGLLTAVKFCYSSEILVLFNYSRIHAPEFRNIDLL